MIVRKTLFDKLNDVLSRSIESGTELCRLKGNPYVELVHWLMTLLQEESCDLLCILRHYQVDRAALEEDLLRQTARLPRGAEAVTDFSYLIELAIEKAWIIASLGANPVTQIRSLHLVTALLSHPELRRALLAISPEFGVLPAEEITRLAAVLTRGSAEQETLITTDSLASPDTEISFANGRAAAENALSTYTTDLTAQARAGNIDPVTGRDSEITTIIDILLRRRQNNPLLTGDAGVGKTAVAEGLALAIAEGAVPPALLNVRLLALDIVGLTAGAGMKGEFESRLKAVLESAARSVPSVILFIDEIHTLVGAGGEAGTGDAANLMKPMLARGEIRTIGATTWSEFKRHIEKDPALTRRFQVVQIDEPSEALSVQMLRGLLPALEQHHQVWILDEALQAAVRLSHRYIPARQLPDKAISLLDTACARVAIGRYTPPVKLQQLRASERACISELALLDKSLRLGKASTARKNDIEASLRRTQAGAGALEKRWHQECEWLEEICALREQLLQPGRSDAEVQALQQQLQNVQHRLVPQGDHSPLVRAEVDATVIAEIIAQWTGIPAGRVMKDDLSTVLELPARLAARVTGQPRALEQICQSVRTARAGLSDPQRPTGVFFLTGPSGTGKTETALALAELLYGGESTLITINMSEFQEAHTVSTLKGSPPGYVGYGEGGILTEAVRRKPYSVVLLDEAEKAHPDVHELFFRIFDKGILEDAEGRRIDFRHTLILLTSNIGSELLSSDSAENTPPDNATLLPQLHALLLKTFPAAFLGRVNIVPYFSLCRASLDVIVRMQLAKVAERLYEQQLTKLKYSDDIVSFIIDHCQAVTSGAREIIHVIGENILPVIATYILSRNKSNPAPKETLFLSYTPEQGVALVVDYPENKEVEL